MPIDKILEEEIGRDVKDYRKQYKEWGEEMRIFKTIEEMAYNQALEDLKSRIPQIKERIIKEIEDELKFMSCTCLKRLEERFNNTLKGGKEK